MVVEPRRRRFTVEDLERMTDAGIFHPDDRLELIEGDIVEMAPINPPHSGCVNVLGMVLMRTVGGRAVLATQNPVRLGDISQPQPDLALLVARVDFYRTSHPTPADVRLLIEVADSTVAMDRSVKMPLYARAGIRESWLVDIPAQRIVVHRGASSDGYRDVRSYAPGETLTIEAFPDVHIDVAEVLGVDPAT